MVKSPSGVWAPRAATPRRRLESTITTEPHAIAGPRGHVYRIAPTHKSLPLHGSCGEPIPRRMKVAYIHPPIGQQDQPGIPRSAHHSSICEPTLNRMPTISVCMTRMRSPPAHRQELLQVANACGDVGLARYCKVRTHRPAAESCLFGRRLIVARTPGPEHRAQKAGREVSFAEREPLQYRKSCQSVLREL